MIYRRASIAKPRVILTGFADEGVEDPNRRLVTEQLELFSKQLGLTDFTPRFIHFGGEGEETRNVVKLQDNEVERLGEMIGQYGMTASSLGSPIGKVKLVNVTDDTQNRFVPMEQYLDEVARGIVIARRLGTNLIRGFSGYPPIIKSRSPEEHRAVLDGHRGAAVDFLSPIVKLCEREGVLFGLEVEANLAGYDGTSLADIKRQVNSSNLVLVFDGANVLVQGLDAVQAYHDMKDGLGWMHIKDCKRKGPLGWTGYVNEELIEGYVPADEGQVGHAEILGDFRGRIPALRQQLAKHGVMGVYLDLEPHLLGGGQFGGYSGPDGMKRALEGLKRVLDAADIGYGPRV